MRFIQGYPQTIKPKKEYDSCEAQEEEIKAYVRSQENLKLYRVHSDPGYSGVSLDKPALKEMLN